MSRPIPKEVQDRLNKLKETINHHRYLYHVLDLPEISGEALDSLKRELVELEQEYPELITPDSPSQRVAGQPLPEFVKVGTRCHSGRLMTRFRKTRCASLTHA